MKNYILIPTDAIDQDQLTQLINDPNLFKDNPDTMMSLPRVFQVYAVK